MRRPKLSMDIDEIIGSLLENWLTRRLRGQCRFCGKFVLEDLPANEQFCSVECKSNWQKVMEVRLAIGKRDLKRRGYD